MMEALARCGDKKYGTIMELPFAKKIDGMLKKVLNEACLSTWNGTGLSHLWLH